MSQLSFPFRPTAPSILIIVFCGGLWLLNFLCVKHEEAICLADYHRFLLRFAAYYSFPRTTSSYYLEKLYLY